MVDRGLCLLFLSVACTWPVACAQGGEGPDFTPPAAGGAGGGGGAGASGGDGGSGGELLLKLPGEACAADGECQNHQCVDDVCCTSPCDGACSTCSAEGQEGLCVPVVEGTDPDGECAPATCGANGSCLYAQHLWSVRFGDEQSDLVQAVAADAQGRVVFTGWFSDQISFGGQTFQSNGGTDAYVAKLDANGAHVWSRRFGDADNQRAYAVALDVGGNVFVTGSFEGTVDFGGGPITAQSLSDLFVVKLDALGNHVWSKGYGPVNAYLTNRGGYAIAVDGAGDVWVTGSFAGQLDFDGNVIDDGSGTQQSTFLVKLHGLDGVHLFSRAIGTAIAADRGNAIALAQNGDVVLCGQFRGTVDFGAGQLVAAGADDAWVARIAPGGAQVWAKSFGGAGNEVCAGLAVDSSDVVWLTGYFDESVDFGGGMLSTLGGADVFLAALGQNGAHVYSQRFGGASTQSGKAIVIDEDGYVVVTGTMAGSMSFGGETLSSEGLDDVFLAKLALDGTHFWSKRYGKNDSQTANGLALVAPNRLALAVSARGKIDFGGQTITSFGAEDVVVALLGP
jgi:hypothetical protein